MLYKRLSRLLLLDSGHMGYKKIMALKHDRVTSNNVAKHKCS